MKGRRLASCAVALAGVALIIQGCSRAPSRVKPPSIDAKAAGAAAMAQYDANNDGKVDAAELEKAPGLKAALANLDQNNDKAVDADEVTRRIQAWQELKTVLTPVMTTSRSRGMSTLTF